MLWAEAAKEVLKANTDGQSMHYTLIAEKIIELQLRDSFGATPSTSVNTAINLSIRNNGENSPFISTGNGYYMLRGKNPAAIPNNNADDNPQLQAEDDAKIEAEIEIEASKPVSEADSDSYTSIIHAYGMFWNRDQVSWKREPVINGRQHVGADSVDFCGQRGIYLLHDGRSVVYVGRSIDRALGTRLWEHTLDRLKGRWDRFSWFGLYKVSPKGELIQVDANYQVDAAIIIATLEAILIEGLEPPQNRRGGDGFRAIEYI